MTNSSSEQEPFTLLERFFSLGDQAAFSASNFVLTIALARFFPSADLATYGIGWSIAIIVQSLQRSTFVVPIALLDDGRFFRRRSGLIGQNLILLTAALSLISAGFFLVGHLRGAHVGGYVAATISSTMIYFPLDFDRAMLLKAGRRAVPFMMSSAYFVTTMTLAALAYLHLITFVHVLLVQGLFGAGKMATTVLLTSLPRFRHALTLLVHNFRTNFGWASICTLAGVGYADAPLLILGMWGNALATAAYVATRGPVQPLAVVVRSLDIVDKVSFGSRVRKGVESKAGFFWRLLRRYLTASVAFAVCAALGSKYLILFIIGPKYVGFELTLTLWAVVFVFMTSILPLETMVYRERRIRSYAFVQAAAGLVGALSAVPLSWYFGASGAVAACLLGWIVVFSLAWTFIVRPILHAEAEGAAVAGQ